MTFKKSKNASSKINPQPFEIYPLPSNATPPNGINNLIIIISILSILRFLIEDYREFGWIMSIPLSEITIEDLNFFFSTMLIIFMRSCVSYFVGLRSLNSCIGLLNILVSEYFIVYLNIYKIQHIYLSGWSLILNLIFLAKIVSFHLSYKNRKILRFNNFLYFLISPTLCYQNIYVLKTSRNYKKILYKFFFLVIGLFLFVFVTDQYSIPSIYRIKKTSDVYILCENAINLALSTALLFIILFNLVFVCCLDILAEITLFKENEFYQAWWNSSSVAEFWTLWNIPVHKWFKRHVYIPLRSRLTKCKGVKCNEARSKGVKCNEARSKGVKCNEAKWGVTKCDVTKFISRGVCFFISALLHEYVLSISTKKFNGLVFLAMMGQIPYIYVSDCIKKVFPSLSNYFFWCSFCIIGQPAMVFLYYRSEDIK
jgi:diacylglycerol O-acyltransferase 1